jgi:hypothetical protein
MIFEIHANTRFVKICKSIRSNIGRFGKVLSDSIGQFINGFRSICRACQWPDLRFNFALGTLLDISWIVDRTMTAAFRADAYWPPRTMLDRAGRVALYSRDLGRWVPKKPGTQKT